MEILSCFIAIQFFLFSLVTISCSKQNTSAKIGQEIIEQNINIFVDELHWSTFEKNKNIIVPIFISNYVTENKLFLDECDCFDIFNMEGFNIGTNSKYESFFIKTVPLKIENKSIKLVEENSNIDLEKFVELQFNNFFLDKDQNRAFLIVEKIGHGTKSWTKEVYFFEKKGHKWKFYKKKLLMIG
ncbi:hypothetical protein [Chryseobacterium sp. P1-3]|uniref:hypothetical protein n=1 Tax=Chryseobacterium sp. (strain P1-3) TaxID=1517683 RepID=UPI000A80AC1D|nr:hypothetical protein [Chryseobacterium sp. P1-3]